MLYFALKGGLGNQLFQAAHAIALSYKAKTDYRFVTESYSRDNYARKYLLGHGFRAFANRELTLQSIPSGVTSLTDDSYSGTIANRCNMLAQLARNDSNLYFDGYWQSEAYFAVYEAHIRGALDSINLSDEVVSLGENIRSRNFIGIHVRRHEYGHHGHAKLSYYRAAIHNIRNIRGNLPVLIFTDEPNFCEFVFRDISNCSVTRGAPDEPLVDLYLLSRCSNYILANSSFSYWAAFWGESEASLVYWPTPYCVFSSVDPLVDRGANWIKVRDAVVGPS